MRFHRITSIIVVVCVCVLAGCKKEPERVDEEKKYTPEQQALRDKINRDGTVVRALSAYKFSIGAYPSTEQGLQALLARPKGLDKPEAWQGPYLEKEEDLIDPWKNQIKYVFPGKTHENMFDLISAGPDGQFDTDDDLLNWNIL